MKILIADDSKLTRSVVRNVLVSNGYDENNILEADNGVAALKLMDNYVIELCVLDWLMPEMDGLELVKHIKSTVKHSKIPVIMMTVVSEYEKVHHALSLGIEDYIVKPLNEKALWNRIYGIITKNSKVSLSGLPFLKKEFDKSSDQAEFIRQLSGSLFQDSESLILGAHIFLSMFENELMKSPDDKDIYKTMSELFAKRITDKRSLIDVSERLLNVYEKKVH
ncbi:MAG: response regulator [Spirochaetota bacterium]|nr:response regulator [Spirochaetota bacterium]